MSIKRKIQTLAFPSEYSGKITKKFLIGKFRFFFAFQKGKFPKVREIQFSCLLQE